jgi:hypothetical protein
MRLFFCEKFHENLPSCISQKKSIIMINQKQAAHDSYWLWHETLPVTIIFQ